MHDKTDNRPARPGDIALAMGLLTRLPVPAALPAPQPDRRIGQSAWAWPVIGAGLGLGSGLAALVATWLGATPGIAAGLALATQIAMTGALHEDGLADTADGFWGAHEPARRMEIMKDSRSGAFGVIALVLSLMMRWSALSLMIGAGWVLAPLVAAGALSRAVPAVLMAALPNARGTGLSFDSGRPGQDAATLAAAVAFALAFVFTGWASLAGAFWAALAAIGLAWLASRKIGGQTGDVLGAGQQLAELAALAAFAATL